MAHRRAPRYRPEQVRAYLDRPWRLFEETAANDLERRSAEQLLRTSSALRKWRHAVAGAPLSEERQEDFLHHQRLKALLERAGAARHR